MKRIWCAAGAGALILALCAGAARAMLLVSMTTVEMVKASEWVVRGTVESVRSDWNESHSMIYTRTTLRVTECYGPKPKQCPKTLVVRQPGGRVGTRVCAVPGMPRYRVGEDVVVFLERARSVGSGKGAPEYQPVGAVQGKYTVTADGRAVRDLTGAWFPKQDTPRSETALDDLVKEIEDAFERLRERDDQ